MNQGEKFKIFLEQNGIEKTEAAKKMGIERATLYQMFKTKRFRQNTADRIRDMFGFNVKAKMPTQNTTHNAYTEPVKSVVDFGEILEKVRSLEERIEELRADKEDLRQQRDDWKNQYLELKKEVDKKRDPRHEDGVSTIPAGPDK